MQSKKQTEITPRGRVIETIEGKLVDRVPFRYSINPPAAGKPISQFYPTQIRSETNESETVSRGTISSQEVSTQL